MTTIRNINTAYGEAIEFTADTESAAAAEMQRAIRDCGPEFATVEITDDDYEIIQE